MATLLVGACPWACVLQHGIGNIFELRLVKTSLQQHDDNNDNRLGAQRPHSPLGPTTCCRHPTRSDHGHTPTSTVTRTAPHLNTQLRTRTSTSLHHAAPPQNMNAKHTLKRPCGRARSVWGHASYARSLRHAVRCHAAMQRARDEERSRLAIRQAVSPRSPPESVQTHQRPASPLQAPNGITEMATDAILLVDAATDARPSREQRHSLHAIKRSFVNTKSSKSHAHHPNG